MIRRFVSLILHPILQPGLQPVYSLPSAMLPSMTSRALSLSVRAVLFTAAFAFEPGAGRSLAGIGDSRARRSRQERCALPGKNRPLSVWRFRCSIAASTSPALFSPARATGPKASKMLKKAVAGMAKDSDLVIYCGCCPMDRCPNIRPAWNALKELGFTHVRVLNIPTNMSTDWYQKDYPSEAGSAGGPRNRVHRPSAKQYSAPNVRTYIFPSAIAGVALLPSPRSLTRSISHCAPAWITATLPSSLTA